LIPWNVHPVIDVAAHTQTAVIPTALLPKVRFIRRGFRLVGAAISGWEQELADSPGQ
jgi:hypothetical protein